MERADVTFASSGDRCAAWHFRPVGASRGCIVMAHGFGGTRACGLSPFAERFADVGFDVLVFDYRCFGDPVSACLGS